MNHIIIVCDIGLRIWEGGFFNEPHFFKTIQTYQVMTFQFKLLSTVSSRMWCNTIRPDISTLVTIFYVLVLPGSIHSFYFNSQYPSVLILLQSRSFYGSGSIECYSIHFCIFRSSLIPNNVLLFVYKLTQCFTYMYSTASIITILRTNHSIVSMKTFGLVVYSSIIQSSVNPVTITSPARLWSFPSLYHQLSFVERF